jgi:hypothetical protein
VRKASLLKNLSKVYSLHLSSKGCSPCYSHGRKKCLGTRSATRSMRFAQWDRGGRGDMWMIGYADRRRATPGLGTTLWTAVAVRRGPWITLCVTHRPHPPRPQPTELHPGFPASPTYPLRPCALRLLGLTALFLFERQKSRGEPPRRRRGGRSPHRGRGQRPRLGGISRFRRGALNGHEVPFGGARSALYSAPLAGGLLRSLDRLMCFFWGNPGSSVSGG